LTYRAIPGNFINVLGIMLGIDERVRPMPAKKRFKTKYPGVFYIESAALRSGKSEKVYYIQYRRDGKLIEEKAGRQLQDDMTPARAARIRGERIEGRQPSNRDRRAADKAREQQEREAWTISRLWREYQAQKSLKGLAQDRSRFDNYLEPYFGDKEPHQIAPFDVDRLRVQMLKTKSRQTVKLTLALLRRIIRFGQRKGLCRPLPFQLELPQVNNETTEDLTAEELSRLLKVLDEDHDQDIANMMRLALFTGMRRGELLNLRWTDLDFDRGFILLRDPKGGRNQTIPMSDAARSVLEKQAGNGSDYVFPGRSGKKRADPRRSLNRIKERAGLPKDFRPLHGLRHAYASILASSGQVDLYTLQKLLTHKSPVMTQRYAHLRDEALRRASNLAGELISANAGQEVQAADLEGTSGGR